MSNYELVKEQLASYTKQFDDNEGKGGYVSLTAWENGEGFNLEIEPAGTRLQGTIVPISYECYMALADVLIAHLEDAKEELDKRKPNE